MSRIILSFILITIVILIACNSNQFNLSKARKDILEQNTKRIVAMKEGDIDTLMELYADDATILPPNDTMKRGKDAINMFYLLTPRVGNVLDASIVSTEITGSETALYEIGEYELTIKPFESDATQTGNCKYLTIWKHQYDGSWKIYAECWNSEPPNNSLLARQTSD
jgi:ketosteroid isomerase-like protein